uniref:t-SNARE coiled-coil homology domain-containing protein n=1 Tax=Arcella intermedia TaxID=1963864 RepID=A0A6B2LS17_9EUKA
MGYVEDDEFAGKSNKQILQIREEKMKDQDVTVDLLLHSVKRQQGIAVAIGEETDHQIGLLDELDDKVGKQSVKIKNTTKRVDKVEQKSSTTCLWITICLLLLALIGVVVAAVETK